MDADQTKVWAGLIVAETAALNTAVSIQLAALIGSLLRKGLLSEAEVAELLAVARDTSRPRPVLAFDGRRQLPLAGLEHDERSAAALDLMHLQIRQCLGLPE